MNDSREKLKVAIIALLDKLDLTRLRMLYITAARWAKYE